MELRTLSATVALLVVAGCSGFAGAEDPEPTTTAVPRAEKVAAPVDTDTDELFDELVTFVEEARGFTFETRPTLRIIEPGAFAVDEIYGDDDEWVLIDESRFHALGILSRDTDYRSFLEAWANSSYIGYYDPSTDEMVIAATESGWGPAVQATIVHELTHAVQERRGELTRADKVWQIDGAEASDAFDALLEGEATLVEELYMESLSARARWLRWEEEAQLAGNAGPSNPYFDYISFYPYEAGARAVTEAYEAGGWVAVDALFDDPPVTTEQLEYPKAAASTYEELISVPDVTLRGFEVVEEEQWGKNDLDAYLLTALPADRETGWGDDWYRLHWDGETAVVVHHLRGDDTAATDRLVEALLAQCRMARLGDAFVVLRAGPDAAYVASLDRATTQSFTAGLAEYGYEVTESC